MDKKNNLNLEHNDANPWVLLLGFIIYLIGIGYKISMNIYNLLNIQI